MGVVRSTGDGRLATVQTPRNLKRAKSDRVLWRGGGRVFVRDLKLSQFEREGELQGREEELI
jgi:hypothetical protein